MLPKLPEPAPGAPLDVALAFVAAINSRDPDAVAALMTDDHRFIDAEGNAVVGRAAMRAGWQVYFAWFPDYELEVEQVASEGTTTALFGYASGTPTREGQPAPDLRFSVPAAWLAVVEGGLVAEWRVYCDVRPMVSALQQAGLL
jgi:ketosteroid isomerase-like protein